MVKHLGNFLKECIENQGLTQVQIAPIYGTTAQNLNKVLGKENLNTEILRKFEKVLGVEFEIKMNRIGVIDITDYNSANRGRKMVYKPETPNNSTSDEVENLKSQILSLRELLSTKDELLKTKDELISLLKQK